MPEVASILLYLSVLVGTLVARRTRMLTRSGAIAAGAAGVTFVAVGGWMWLIPAILFFLPSSLLSMVGRDRKQKLVHLTHRTDERDIIQVLANGGIAWILALAFGLTGASWLYWMFLGSFAASAADTWATELGSLSARRPRMILSGKQVLPGTSGAVTLRGLVASIAGSAVVVIPSLIWAPDGQPIYFIAAMVVTGFVGAAVDSLAGATIQTRYAESLNGEIIGGISWVNNDVVNLICTGVGAFLGFASQMVLL